MGEGSVTAEDTMRDICGARPVVMATSWRFSYEVATRHRSIRLAVRHDFVRASPVLLMSVTTTPKPLHGRRVDRCRWAVAQVRAGSVAAR